MNTPARTHARTHAHTHTHTHVRTTDYRYSHASKETYIPLQICGGTGYWVGPYLITTQCLFLSCVNGAAEELSVGEHERVQVDHVPTPFMSLNGGHVPREDARGGGDGRCKGVL